LGIQVITSTLAPDVGSGSQLENRDYVRVLRLFFIENTPQTSTLMGQNLQFSHSFTSKQDGVDPFSGVSDNSEVCNFI